MDQHPSASNLIGSGSKSRRLGWLGLIALIAAALAIGALILAPRDEGVRLGFGPGLSIALVAPTEPQPIDGGVLDVGQLNDNFDRAALEREPESVEVYYLPPEAYAGSDWPLMPLPQPVSHERADVWAPEHAPRDPLEDGSRLFGFDTVPRSSSSSETQEVTAQMETDNGTLPVTTETLFQ